jgi:hypothetical protein
MRRVGVIVVVALLVAMLVLTLLVDAIAASL